MSSTVELVDVRAALAAAITAGTGLRMIPYALDTIPAPCGVIDADEFDPRMVFGRAKATYPFIVRVFVGRVAEKAAFKKLDVYRNPSAGITSAVEDPDNWPDDLVDTAYVTLIGRPGEATVADETYLICDFNIEVVC